MFPQLFDESILRGAGLVQWVAGSTVNRCVIVGSSPPRETEHFGFPPVLRDWVIKGPGMSSRVCAAGHTKDPMPLIGNEKGIASRWSVSS